FQRFHNLPHHGIHFNNEVSPRSHVGSAHVFTIRHTWHMNMWQCIIEKKGLILMLMDKRFRLIRKYVSKIFIFPISLMPARHITYTADSVNNSSAVLGVSRHLQHFGMFETNGIFSYFFIIIHLDRISMV